MTPAYLRRAALLAILGWPLGASAACPVGQMEICFTSCICVPDVEQVRTQVLGSASVTLERWILQSRDTALMAGTQPMPLQMRAQLAPYYDSALLDTVRFRVGALDEMDVASAMLQNPDIQAVTLVDVVVFRSQEAAEQDIALWAHELWHAKQYREWGSTGFAQRYTRDFEAVEKPAYDMQIQVMRALRAAKTP
ncbi:eCIS core domain-containing protein [Pseudomonas sp. Gutcm_11s]|uniref:eCIS core domain-containing protein n=1 Tax=Pseudomonas sp. Gutcm_11s TaxID=3026088 RepID=UPI0023622A83|nr:DUF4157 domain-containing protein [Pseudomonas sp. Gutcm_11s]MDD0843734.1 DUF4157 domain-containing protein [Pseudomonas sp. Gutcm_11s]